MNVSRGTKSGRGDDELVAYPIDTLMFLKSDRLIEWGGAKRAFYHKWCHAGQMLLNSNSVAVQRHFRATKRAHVQKRG